MINSADHKKWLYRFRFPIVVKIRLRKTNMAKTCNEIVHKAIERVYTTTQGICHASLKLALREISNYDESRLSDDFGINNCVFLNWVHTCSTFLKSNAVTSNLSYVAFEDNPDPRKIQPHLRVERKQTFFITLAIENFELAVLDIFPENICLMALQSNLEYQR